MSPIFTIRSTRPELVVRLRSEIQQLAWFSQGAGLLRGTDFGNVFSCALAKTRGLPGLDADRLDHRPDLVVHRQHGGEFLSPRGRRHWPVRTGSAAVRLPLARPHSDPRRDRVARQTTRFSRRALVRF
jgi:hypothetical protein